VKIGQHLAIKVSGKNKVGSFFPDTVHIVLIEMPKKVCNGLGAAKLAVMQGCM